MKETSVTFSAPEEDESANVPQSPSTESFSTSEGKDPGAGDAPLKGETPPLERKAKILQRMSAASRNLKEDGKEWIEKHIRRRDSSSSSSSEEGEKK